MNKKTIFTALAFIVFLVAGVIAYQRTTTSEVEFILADHVDQIRILSTDDSQEVVIATLSSSENVILKDGVYEVVVRGNRSVPDSVFIEVPQDSVVAIDPDYSRQYLEEILASERTGITTAIENNLGSKLDGYTVAEGELLRRGEWYTSIIYEDLVDVRQERDTYKILLNKNDEAWQLVAGPEIVLTIYDYPELPVDILTQANESVFSFSVSE